MFFFDIIEVSHSFSSLRVKLDALDDVVDVNSEPLSDVASALISAVNPAVNTSLVPVCGGENPSVNTADEILVVDDFCDDFFSEFMIDELPADNLSIADNSVVDEVADELAGDLSIADNSVVDEPVNGIADHIINHAINKTDHQCYTH